MSGSINIKKIVAYSQDATQKVGQRDLSDPDGISAYQSETIKDL